MPEDEQETVSYHDLLIRLGAIMPDLRKVTITRESMIVPMIFLLDNIPYKSDINAETGLGVIQGIELTNRENMLVQMILRNRQGQIDLATAFPAQWEELQTLRRAFLALIEMAPPARLEESTDRVTILEWKERFTAK